MAKRRGPGQKATRPPRPSNVPRDDDPTSELEVQLEAGASKRRIPPSKEIGPTKRAVGATANGSRSRARATGGSDVAPTALAAEREKAQHAVESKAGRQAAGLAAGGDKKRGSTRASRAAVDEAAHEADRLVTGHDVLTRTSTSKPTNNGRNGAPQARR